LTPPWRCDLTPRAAAWGCHYNVTFYPNFIFSPPGQLPAYPIEVIPSFQLLAVLRPPTRGRATLYPWSFRFIFHTVPSLKEVNPQVFTL